VGNHLQNWPCPLFNTFCFPTPSLQRSGHWLIWTDLTVRAASVVLTPLTVDVSLSRGYLVCLPRSRRTRHFEQYPVTGLESFIDIRRWHFPISLVPIGHPSCLLVNRIWLSSSTCTHLFGVTPELKSQAAFDQVLDSRLGQDAAHSTTTLELSSPFSLHRSTLSPDFIVSDRPTAVPFMPLNAVAETRNHLPGELLVPCIKHKYHSYLSGAPPTGNLADEKRQPLMHGVSRLIGESDGVLCFPTP